MTENIFQTLLIIKMNIITLPDELNIDISSPVQVFDYTSSQEVSRQQIILNQNAFSFLIDGSKEVVFDNSSLSIDNSKFILMRSGHCLMTERLSDLKNYRSILFSSPIEHYQNLSGASN